MAGLAILLKIKLPFFSLRVPEAFQVASSLPVPSPSALVGALAYALAIHSNISNEAALNYARKIVLAARATIPEAQTYTLNPILLWRFRILDRGMERPKKKGIKLTLLQQLTALTNEGRYSEAKTLLELKLKDALYREYIFAPEVKVVYLVKEKVDTEIFKLISRLGDTESLCSVIEVKTHSYELVSVDKVETTFPFVYTDKVSEIKGDFMIMKQSNELRELKLFVIPITRRILTTKRGGKVTTLWPSKLKVSFKDFINVAKVNNEYIVV